MEELDFDVIVVGGGPAGSSAARMVAENGCTVALIEKEEEIAETVRTSGVTWISDIEKFGIQCRKLIVPSIGSIIHLNSSSFSIFPDSSLKIE